MGLRVVCPNCGSRPYTEFSFGGEVTAALDDSGAEDEDFRRVWWRANAAGVQSERWFHAAGCRRWLTAERDTTTNRFHAGA